MREPRIHFGGQWLVINFWRHIIFHLTLFIIASKQKERSSRKQLRKMEEIILITTALYLQKIHWGGTEYVKSQAMTTDHSSENFTILKIMHSLSLNRSEIWGRTFEKWSTGLWSGEWGWWAGGMVWSRIQSGHWPFRLR